MRILLFIILSTAGIYSRAQQSIPPIGLWREHLPYNSALDVTSDNEKIYCATPYSLFTVHIAENLIERFSRITGLTETGISAIKYDYTNSKLIIAYTNSNIDIIYRNDIINVPDIKRDNIAGDKTIYNIYPLQQYYYLSTGLGIIVIDAEKYEVKDSWFIGTGGSKVKINGFTSDGIFFYAATEEGLKRAVMNSPNLNNYLNWQLLSGGNGLPAGSCRNVLNISDKTIAEKNDSLFVLNGNNWNLFYTDGWSFINSNVSSDKIILCQKQSNGQGKVTILNTDGTVSGTLMQPGPVSGPGKTILVNNDPWLADQNTCLIHFTTSSFEQYKPDSPEATASGDMTVYNNTFYATAGEVNKSWNYQYNDKGIFVFDEGLWENINRSRFPKIDSLLDYITIAIDRRDETIWAGSYGGGLLHVKGDKQSFEIFKQGIINPAVGDPSSYRVSGLAFDHENNLWVSNFGAVQPLLVRKSDGSWKNFSIPFLLPENSLAQILIDDNNYKWIVAAKTGTVICFDDNSSIDNIGDDRWKLYGAGAGNGNLPAGEVLCVAKDNNG
ncbi:MAG TPA: hypothetical protein VI461_04405, partial [Chitinophagaceae bacterium]|nr:hypothetical protein [Chitinophagaceae bacterium]